jgi:hypothetical protein
MPRYRRPPLTLKEICLDGPPVRVRELCQLVGLAEVTVYADIELGVLHARKRSARVNAPYLIERWAAREWLESMLGSTWKQEVQRSNQK